MTGAYGEYRIPTNAVEGEILTGDGRTFRGRVFLPDVAATHRGPMRAAEWLNDRTPFFPFLPDDGSAPVLLNRHEVVAFTVAAEADADLDDPETAGGMRRKVIVECSDRRFEGDIVIDMPPHLRRPSDFLNQPDPILIVEEGDRHHLIRKARITRILDSREK
jgi:hypothetical protein